MPLEGIPVAAIMLSVTLFLVVSAFIVFGFTCFNMRKKRNVKQSKPVADVHFPADTSAAVVIPVISHQSLDVEKNAISPLENDKAANSDDDTIGANSEGDSDATLDANAADRGSMANVLDATVVAVDSTASAANATATAVDTTPTTVDIAVTVADSAVSVDASAAR